MANSHMTFGVDLLPKTTNTYNLGNSSQKWNLFANEINANELKLGNQNKNLVLAGPSTENAAAPTFRALVAADIPTLTKSKISDFDHTHPYIALYETRSQTDTLNKVASYGAAGAMFHLLASSSTSTTNNGKTPTDANILQMNWDTNGGYDSQLGISTQYNRMWFRSKSSQQTAWNEIAHAPVGVGVGSSSQPVYMTSTGVITACTDCQAIEIIRL